MKKNKLASMLSLLLLSSLSIAGINRDCLLEFHVAVAEAQLTHEQDLVYCNGQLIVVKCVMEAGASFQNSVYNAVQGYNDCSGG